MPVEFAQHRRHRPDEHACVPTKVAGADERFGQLRVRFLAETFGAMNRNAEIARGAELHRRTLLDVAKTRRGPCWLDADRDQRARLLRGDAAACTVF